ncbi:MAG: TldD/PmbA family protein [Candidatus Eremiobacteraeota bacterium]|nr:TldD/PmbA family protein [Candidatus Eremiobacteraeota bacterium]
MSLERRYAGPAGRALDTASKRGAAYADAQVWEMSRDRLIVRNGVVRTVENIASLGIGIRAFVDGSWGFAGTDALDDAGIDRAADIAVALARAGTRVPERIRAVEPTERYVDTYETPMKIDPATVGLSQRVALLLAAEKALHVDPAIVSGTAFIFGWDDHKEFYSTKGSAIGQRLVRCGSGLRAEGVRGNDTQRRSGPSDFGFFQAAGFEVVEQAKLVEHAAQYGREVMLLLGAETLPRGRTALILDGTLLNIQMHESIGHPLELDRALGWEANFSGVSWATPDRVGKLRYGSDKLTIYCDNTLPGGMATSGYDDDGVKPRRVALIERGILRGFESSRDTAAQTGLPQTASMRAQNWASIPMVRISNIALAPGEGTLEQIVAETGDGVLMSGLRSWSIDDHRLNFQFGPEIAWEVKNGKRGKVFRNPTYTGVTPDFWGKLDRVSGASEFVAYGTPNCGKGEPGQIGHTTQACSNARFADVLVGVKADA